MVPNETSYVTRPTSIPSGTVAFKVVGCQRAATEHFPPPTAVPLILTRVGVTGVKFGLTEVPCISHVTMTLVLVDAINTSA